MNRKRIRLGIIAGACAGLVCYYFVLPNPLFEDPYSTVLQDRNGHLLSATIANDGQWRFPELSSVPDKFAQAIVLFEDKRFENHPGVDLLAMGRSMQQNIRAGKVVSGGSTLTMQVVRLSRKGKPRTILEKLTEMLLATRMEFRYTKAEILRLYASHAPFGGNVVGMEAACWRYFGRDPQDVDWAEAALLAVLPNNPSLLHLGRNRERLKVKRDRLLKKLRDEGRIDSLTAALAQTEEIPDRPLPLPRHARHLLARSSKDGFSQTKINSTIDINLQEQVERVVADHHDRLKSNLIYNAAVLVVEVKTGDVLAYVGNTEAGPAFQDDVDIVTARRSSGSILKPFLFAAMINEGKMLQSALVPDVPTSIGGFVPRNFSHQFDGAVAADRALIRSLNIPFVWELKEYRYEKFHDLLRNIGFTSLNRSPDHYGLTLILGGAEATLWDITGAYASMARTLNNYFDHPGKNRYDRTDFHSLRYMSFTKGTGGSLEENSILSAASVWLTFETLKEVFRPGEETGWRRFNTSKKIAWKTGTSIGFRDGWAVGVNPDYAVGVWTGNADGEGRPGLLGTESAAPILFDLFSLLPGHPWFQRPSPEMEEIAVCLRSGQRATELCSPVELMWVAQSGLQTTACQFHKRVYVSTDGRYRLHRDCSAADQMKAVNWFVLPPIQEFYFRPKNVTYQPLPPFRSDCANPSSLVSMELIYPKPNARIFVPRELDGEKGSAVFEVAHRIPTATVYWHLDGNYVGSTKKAHHLALAPAKGQHVLTLVDDSGESLERAFTILSTQ